MTSEQILFNFDIWLKPILCFKLFRPFYTDGKKRCQHYFLAENWDDRLSKIGFCVVNT